MSREHGSGLDAAAQNRGTIITRGISAVTTAVGSFPAIMAACALMTAWLIGGIWVRGGYGNQLYEIVVSTVSSIVTFIMVFVIQSSQNRDSRAIQAKLDAQTHLLAALAHHFGFDDHGELVSRLTGLEDAPEARIRQEQQRVRADVANATQGRLPGEAKP